MPPKAVANTTFDATQLYDSPSRAKAPSLSICASKRCFDVVVALLLLGVLAPVMLLIAIAIKMEGKGSVIFTQSRTGLYGRTFRFYKFRSMLPHNTPHNTLDYVKENDPRITRLGAFLRKTSLDELPQLWNVVIGDMSLVGPRPQHTYHLEYYQSKIHGYRRRYDVRPGITGPVQISPLRDKVDDMKHLRKAIAMDLDYVDNHTLWLDLRILYKTAFRLVH